MAFHHLELEIKRVVSNHCHNKKEADKSKEWRLEREYSRLAFTKAVEYITNYRKCCIPGFGWPLFLPKAQDVSRQVTQFYELINGELNETKKNKKERQTFCCARGTGAPSSAEKKPQTTPPSPTSPADANAPPFPEDMA
jgi:hypothetical protein